MLTDTAARKAVKRDKDYKLFDERGLYLFISKAGGKGWRFKYRFGGKEQAVVFGPYPEISLSEARELRDEARKLLRDNKDPRVERKKVKLSSIASSEVTFAIVAREWHTKNLKRWSTVHADDVITSLEKDVFPSLGGMPLREISTPMVLECLRKVETRGAGETSRRLRQRISSIYVYAMGAGIAIFNPAPAEMTKAMEPVRKAGKQPALVGIEQLRGVLLAAEASSATPVVKAASRLLALTAVRPGVVIGATWGEFEGIDWDTREHTADALWRIPPARMKLMLDRKDEIEFEHLVPLTSQAIDLLRTIRRLTGRMAYVFPSQRHSYKSMSANAIGYLYNRVGFHSRHVPHGWRAAFSTTMNERAVAEGRTDENGNSADRAIIDLMLAHVPANKVEGAYNRAQYMPTRRRIAETWSNLISEGLVDPAEFLTAKTR
ncbi:DUF4102 domain-containing protein (plasmid) [Sphingomonas paeninsulae]|uniref:DUF4102 domain-containing protein n=1 Tax=Sphingomonas paeninsulae TaxID=2319844 RepID=A0A494TIQ6_SPHPE|nr:integrase arm-type DNA-binding domain-containing protein [Sphingomonas paeninsulae]AYJ85308.1 DUF4102 domain-containing protein [Sphingomonas paeninsulae]